MAGPTIRSNFKKDLLHNDLSQKRHQKNHITPNYMICPPHYLLHGDKHHFLKDITLNINIMEAAGGC